MTAERARRDNINTKMERVLTVARELFVSRGYHNVSVPAIVKASGVSTGAIYSYFGSKENLARRIHEDTLARFQNMFLQRLEGVDDIRCQLEAFGYLCFDLVEREAVMMEYMLFMKHDEFMRDTTPICFTEPFKKVRAIISAGMDSGVLRRQDVYTAAITYTGVVLRAVELRLMCILPNPLPQISGDLLENAWIAIKR